ncbi:peptidyl-dipeptidase Dcp [Massilia sp. MP_M2]|uniref:M3 family metallopeptidase n=1 Tax=Massilia sp. MP_M2 TaxID=3071713 RepID=UPI00319E5496
MNRPKLLLIAAGVALATLAFSKSASAALPASNPFAKPSTLQYGYPAFDKIKNEHFAPAFDEGMREQAAEIGKIASNKAAPTFDNTIVAMERSGELLGRVRAVFYTLTGSYTNDTLQALDKDLAPKFAAHSDAIRLNPALFARIKTLHDKRATLGLDAESAFLLERYYKDFVRAGANLSAADKVKLKEYNGKLAALQTQFSQNVLKEVNASAFVVDTRAELAGLPEKAIDAAAAEATKRGLEGKFVIPVVNTTQQAPLAVLTNRATREKLLTTSMIRGNRGGEFDNRDVVLQLAKLRAERAELLGYENYAAYSLEDQTAKNTTSVNKLLGDLTAPAVRNAKKEGAEIQAVIDAEKGGFKLAAQDWAIYSDKVRTAKYAFDADQLKPYFEFDNVLEKGTFFAATKLWGITFKRRTDLPTYDADVRVYDVFEENGAHLAIFVVDPYARPNKRGGAWMSSLVNQSFLLDKKPVITNNLNLTKPAPGEPTLLTWDEVRTTFHEFGHATHGWFSKVKYPRFSGTSVPRDYVELPSQVYEMWMAWPEVMASYAKHYQTGAVMPKELLDKLRASQKFNEGYRTTEYLAAAVLDQRWHQLGSKAIPTDVKTFEQQALKDAGLDFAPVPPRYSSTYFSHAMGGGYSAGYYSYLWAERLDADAGEWFKENGGLQRKNGDRFRNMVLSKGGTVDAVEMYRAFRGRDPVIEPLLERRGLN